jgi:16S rRNA (cytosine967-C5)-methyltransferase
MVTVNTSKPQKTIAPASKRGLIDLRIIAVKTLAQVLAPKGGLTLDEAFTSVIHRNSKITPPVFDRNWLFELLSGVLRYKGRLDFIIDTYAHQKKPTGSIRRYLYTGAYQLLVQDAAPALVVSETVEAVRKSEGETPSKFVNAILRKIAEAEDSWKSWTINSVSAVEEQIAWCSLPAWLFYSLRKERGIEFVIQFAEACLKRPDTWYRAVNAVDPILLQEGYTGTEPIGMVQDISNQTLISEVTKDLNSLWSAEQKQSAKILDLCAAPGGKAIGLVLNGFNVTATDRDENRLIRVVENRSRLGLSEEQLRVLPFEKIYSSDEKWDLIWLDVPCLSTGIIRRHPEIRWNRTEADLEKILKQQKELLAWAGSHLLPGGQVIYSTCSLLKKENEIDQKNWSVQAHWEFLPQLPPYGDGIVASLLRYPVTF